MRVIAGTARRIQLRTPEGLSTRPTTDRIKETLFNMIWTYLPDSNFLDLYSGSGAIGIEALSRGAKTAVFVENQREAVCCIKDNLEKTGFTPRAEILPMDTLSGLKALEQKKKSFDIIFMDPPYGKEEEQKVLDYLKQTALLKEEGIVIFEALAGCNTDFVSQCNFTIEKIKKYKTNMHVFVKQA